MNRKIVLFVLIVVISMFFSFVRMAGAGRMDNPFKVGFEKDALRIEPGANAVVRLVISCPPGHYIYKEKTYVDFIALQGIRVSDIAYPAAKPHQDAFSGKLVDVFDGEVMIDVTFAVPKDAKGGTRSVEGVVAYQGCSPELCFRETTEPVAWTIQIPETAIAPDTVDSGASSEGASETLSPKAAEGRGFFEMLLSRDFKAVVEHGLLFAFLAAFIGGLLTSLTPCVLPIIPITLLVIGVQRKGSIGRNFLFSLLFVTGIAATYSALGIIAAAVGVNMGFLFQERFFIALLVIFFVAMSLSMFGLFELQLPLRMRNRLAGLGGAGFFGAFLAGISVGLLAAPCVGPVLGPILVFVAATKSLYIGFWLLATYAMGMGLLILVIGTFYGALAGRIKGGNLGIVIKRVIAVLLLLPAIYYGRYLLPRPAGTADAPGGGISWVVSEDEAFRLAKDSGSPVMIDFYADWCPPCQALKQGVFIQPDVIALAKAFVPWRVDATVSDEKSDAVMDKYGILGLPTIIFAGPDGTAYDDLTLTGADIDAEMIIEAMEKALERSGKDGV